MLTVRQGSGVRVLPKIDAMELIQAANPFDDPDWLFEVKYDGFLAAALRTC